MIFSIFVANVANLINTDRILSKKHNLNKPGNGLKTGAQHRYFQIDDSPGHLMWFLQVNN